MSLTFRQAKDILAKYEGKGGKVPSAKNLDTFVIKVLQYLLISGSPNSERVFELYAVNGMFTAPYEMEVPLKFRVNGRVGNAVSKWFEFRSGNDFGNSACHEASDTLYEDANVYYTVYDLPSCGAYVGVMGTVDEDCEANLIVSGPDNTGREIFTNHQGAEIAGEKLMIRKNQITWSNVLFSSITGIVKPRTNGYTPLYWRSAAGLRGFLSDYSPVEESPSYRRFRLSIPNCPSPAKLSVLARTRLKHAYADTDRIPFDNMLAIEVAGQQVQAGFNDKIEVAVQKDDFLQQLTSREHTHKRLTNGQPIEIFHATSGGTIRGLVDK